MRGDDQALIVMDLEWTAWNGSRQRHWSAPGEEMEIVQIGAVKLANSAALEELDAFEILVRPRINPTLDSYFIDLTGITQDVLDRDGVDLKDALATFADFIGPVTACFGFGDELEPIATNCQLYGLADCRCDDVRAVVMARLGVDWMPYSSDLPELMDFTPPGAMHQGLSDSRCVAEALRRARKASLF